MNREALVGLLNNAVFLLALSVLYDFIPRKTRLRSRESRVVTGVILGLIGTAVMLSPWQIMPGINFDTRSILLSTAGRFFGMIPTIIAASFTITVRLLQGGAGVVAGILVIVVSAGMGIGWRRLRYKGTGSYSWQELYVFGLLVHVAMLLCMFALPATVALEVLGTITVPVLFVFPIGVTVLGKLLSRQLRRQQIEEKHINQANILRNVSDAVVTTDMDLRITSFNRAAEKLYGWQAEEVTGKKIGAVLPTVYDDGTGQEMLEQILKEGAWQGEVRQTRRDGEMLYTFSSVTLLKDDQGSPVGAIAVNRDITQDKEAKEALQSSEETLRLLADNARDIIYHFQLVPDRRFTYISPAVTGITGYTPEAFYEDPDLTFKLLQPEQAQQLQIMDREQGKFDLAPISMRWELPNGNVIWLEHNSAPVFDDHGNLVGLEGIARDTTSRKTVESQNELLLSLTTAVATASNLDAAWRIALQKICEATGWELGEIWQPAADGQHLEIGDPFYGLTEEMRAFWAEGAHITFNPNEGLPGKVWVAKQPLAMANIGEQENSIRAKRAQVANLKGNIAIPVMANREVVAVMNFLLFHNPSREDEEMMTIVSAVAAQLGVAVQHKQAVDRLRLRDAALNTAANAIVLTDTTGVIEWVNPSFTSLTGYSADDATGQKFGELLNSGMHDPLFFQEMWETILSGKVWRGELINQRKDGSLYTEEQTVTPVRDENGDISHFIAIKQDITARKESEADRTRLLTRIQNQADRIQQIIDTVPAGVLMVDTQGRVMLANPAAQEYLEVLTELDEFANVSNLGDKSLAELLTPLPVGHWHEITVDNRIFELIARPAASEEATERWVLVINEVTEERARQRYQQAQQQLSIVGQLAAGIAHDFNNIMGVIMIYAQMLEEIPELPEDSYTKLATINDQAQHATGLIRQILDFSRRSIMDKVVLDLLLIIKELVKLLERTLPENIYVSLSYNENEYKIYADPTRIQQALMNLALNARDAMPQGGELRFELAHLAVDGEQNRPLPDVGPGDWVQLVVGDTGIGIPEKIIPHLFEPFFTTKDPDKGTGLGLAQVHGIVKQHDGSIDVSSELGKGSVFVMYLPLVDLPTSTTRTELASGSLSTGRETILLVEDNMAMRISISQALDRLGYQTLMATNGREALEVLANHTGKIDLLVSDLVMPGMSGTELFDIACRDYPNIKKLLITGHLPDDSKDQLLQGGEIGWLAKPFDMATLADKVRAVLEEEN